LGEGEGLCTGLQADTGKLAMAKNIPESKFTELKGLDRISQTVHDMDCIWREQSKDDMGIDGEIEVLMPKVDGKGFQTTGRIIKVQAKSGASYVVRDSDNTFAVPVKKEDLEYWNTCTFPVFFIVYHPKDDKLYCKEVKSYIDTMVDVLRPPHQICFDKAHDEFGLSYRATLLQHATVSPTPAAGPKPVGLDIRTPNIFICYRRVDSEFAAQAIHERLVSHFGQDAVFLDVDSIPPGQDFHGILNEMVAQCDLLLAVIGDHWLNVLDEAGQRRLDNPDDFVRIEIEAALSRDIPVIPVLIGRAVVPKSQDLPSTLRGLSKRQSVEVRAGRDFHSHLERLVRDIERTFAAYIQRLSLRSDLAVEEALRLAANDMPRSVTALVELLKDEDDKIRGVAARTLKNIGPDAETAVPPLIELLKDKERKRWATAANVLGDIGPYAKAAVPVLTELLRDGEKSQAAARALGDIGPDAKTAVPVLTELLKDENRHARWEAASALGKFGPDAKTAVLALTELLGDEETWCTASEALGKIGPDARTAIPALTEVLLRDKTLVNEQHDDRVRLGVCAAEAAARALGKIGPEAIPALANLLKNEELEEEIRQVAARALGEIGPEAIATLTELLEDNQEGVRRAAASALGKCGPEAKTAVPALTELLANKENWWDAADALGKIGPDAKTAIPALKKKLLGGESMLKALVEILMNKVPLWNESKSMSKVVVESLMKVGPDAIPALTELLSRRKAWRLVVKALGEMGPEARTAVPALTELLKHKKKRWDAALALGQIGPEAKTAVPVLTELLKHNDVRVWHLMARQVSDIVAGTKSYSMMPRIAFAAATALGNIGPEAKSAIPALTQLLNYKDEDVRSAAAKALKKIKKEK
jgi:HEAT repeat protein